MRAHRQHRHVPHEFVVTYIRSGRMIHRVKAPPDIIQDLIIIITAHVHAREVLGSHQHVFQRLGLEDLACTLEARNSDLLVSGVGQPVWIDNR